MNLHKVEVELCLGSACYSRGNGEAIDILEKFVHAEALEELVSLKGRLCTEECALGPCIRLNGSLYTGVRPECAVDLLRYHLQQPCAEGWQSGTKPNDKTKTRKEADSHETRNLH